MRLAKLIGGRVGRSAVLSVRSGAASANELATAIAAAEDCIDPRSACPDPRRAVGFVEFKPGEEPERFDECTGPMDEYR
jgi:hypothetical protein